MFIAIKDTKVICIHEVEWRCRKDAKGLTKLEYWTWLESVTTKDENGFKIYDFSGEDYEIVETEINVQEFYQSGHITETIDEISSEVFLLKFAFKSFLSMGPDKQLQEVHGLSAKSLADTLSRTAVLIFSPALIIFVIQFIFYFNTSEKHFTCFPKLCVKSGALKLS